MSRVRRLRFAILLASVAVLPVLVFPPHKTLAPTGPYSIATARDTYTDPQRGELYAASGEPRRVNVAFWYPENAHARETYPLVVFSHGGLGTENSNASLYRELASHGYVVCALGHPYQALWTKSIDGRAMFVSREYFGELQREDAKSDKQQSLRYYRKWLAIRTADIRFVLDTILARAAHGADGVYARVDGARIGVMGHSLGGSAALAIPRQRNDVAAVIALESPVLYDIVGVVNDEFVFTDQPYPVPVLNIYSDSAWGHLSQWPQYARNAAWLADAPPVAFSLHLPGAGHFSLTDLALASPLLTQLLEGGQPPSDRRAYLRQVNHAVLEFFDRCLKYQAGCAVAP